MSFPPLGFDLAGVAVGLEQPQHAINVSQVGAVLFQLAFKLFDQPGDANLEAARLSGAAGTSTRKQG
jgi:hypothetical protein